MATVLRKTLIDSYKHAVIIGTLLLITLVKFLTGNINCDNLGNIDALFLVRRLQEEHRAKDKRMYMCFVDFEKAFDRVPRRVLVGGTELENCLD